MEKQAYDVLIMTTPADFQRLRHLYPRLADCLSCRKLIFVGNREVVRLVGEAGYEENVTAIDEDEILPFNDVHTCMTAHMAGILRGRELPRGVTGWYYQQFLKLEYAKHCEDDYYMTWDGDTIPCRKISMFKEGTDTPFLDLKHEHHAEYFETMGRLVPGLEKLIERSFISEHMLFQRDICRELTDAIEANDALPGEHFWEKIIHAIPVDKIQSSAFSEFETYGTYVALKHPSAYRLREWHSFRLGGEFFDPDTICDRDFAWLGKDFDAISFEKNMSVREDHKNLFDNPAYQQKLTPRQMLEAAQKEFKDGYVEVWDDGDATGGTGTTANRTNGAFGDSANPASSKTQTEQIAGKLRYLQPDTWKIYAELGESLLDTNPDQAYLCYENALFLYEQDRDDGMNGSSSGVSDHNGGGTDPSTVRGSLTQVLQMLRESGEVSVRNVTALILSYNELYLTQKCIESVRTHCNPGACDILVVDNGSEQDVQDWLSVQHDISTVMLGSNMGFPAGCNAGLRVINKAGEARDVLLLNNDTRMTPNALFWLRMALYEGRDIGAAGSMANYTNPDQRIDVEFPLPEDYVKYGAKINVPTDTPWEEREKLSGFALLLKRSVMDEVALPEEAGLLDEAFSPGYFEDTDLCIRIRRAGYKLLLCKNSFIYHAGSQSFAKKSEEEIEALFTRNYHILCDKWGKETAAALFSVADEEVSAASDIPEDESSMSSGMLQNKTEHTTHTTGGVSLFSANEVRPADIRLIIWDLDDTFWDGTLTENEGGQTDPSVVRVRETAVKLARTALDLGIMNSICSRNDFAPAMDALADTPYGDLRELFVFPSINWDAKGARVKQIIEDMGLRAANVLFLDDSDFNLREAKFLLPELMTGTPDIAGLLLQMLEEAGVPMQASDETGFADFPEEITLPDGSKIVTDPEHKRLAHYRVLETKREERKQSTSNEQFLKDSDIRVQIETDCMPHIDRIAELVARTNQLNYTKRRDTRKELEALVQADDISCAVVQVKDKYGDYGIVGFYAIDLAEDVLIHFLFSCRTLGMGVEQYVYQKLGFPILDAVGEIAQPLKKESIVTWIREESSTEATSKHATEHKSNAYSVNMAEPGKDIFIKGPCDIDQMLPYLQQEITAPLYLETNFVDERGVIVAGNNNLLHIREAREYTRTEILENIGAAPFLSMDDFETDMFSESHGVVFFSLLSEVHSGVYRNKQTGFRICFSSCNFDLTDPKNEAKYISGEYPNHNFPFTPELIARFRDAYEFEGSLSAEEIADNVSWLRETLPPETRLILLCGSEIEAEPNTEEFADHAPKYRAVNELLRQRFGDADSSDAPGNDTERAGTGLLNVTDFITGQDCFAGCTNHFSRKMYRDIALQFAGSVGKYDAQQTTHKEGESPMTAIQPYADGVSIIVTVHNEFDNAVKCIESIRMNAGMEDVDLVVADNGSTDNFPEWAKTQTDFTYVRFEEGFLPYGTVLNQILTGIDLRKHILILCCRYMLTEGCLSALLKTAGKEEVTGVVGCVSNDTLSPLHRMEPEEWESFAGKEDEPVYGWMEDAFCLTTDTLNRVGLFDDGLFTIMQIVKDYSLRLLQQGNQSRLCNRAYLYAFRGFLDEPEDMLIHQPDDENLLRKKWGVHYISIVPNLGILSAVKAPEDKPLQVLEVGCDIGATLWYIRQKYPNAEIHGCDINPDAVKIAGYSMDAFVNNIEEESLPFAPGSLDVVIFADVLEHLHHPLQTIRYIGKLLKEDGCILASIPNLMHISVMRQLLHGDFSYTEGGLLDKTHIHFFTYNEILRLFREGGYELDMVTSRDIAMDERDRELIERLCALDAGAKPFMYEAFQYLLRAKKLPGGAK